MLAFDSLRAHNGCLSLFDVKDLAKGISGLSIQDVKPRHFQLRRVSAAASTPAGGHGGSSSSSSQAPRMLLPVVSCEADLDPVSQRVTAGCFLFVHSDSKVQVVRDRRTRHDLALAFPEVDEDILHDVWKRTQLFCAASTILTSLVNSGHHVKAAHDNTDSVMDLEDRDSWPSLLSLSEACQSEGWVIVEDGGATSLAEVKIDMMDDESKVGTGSASPSRRSHRRVVHTDWLTTGGGA
jgi:hypothetical protein